MSEAEYLAMDPGYDPGDYLSSQSTETIKAFLKVPLRKALLQEMIGDTKQASQELSFLDVGCGMGGYMLAASELGMTTLGFEPSADHGKIANERLHLDVVNDYFTEDKVGGRKFDVALLSHVIEHIHNPKAFVADLVSVLKPGGKLIMITPNADALSARITGRHWPMLVPLDHVTMLTKNSVPWLVPEGCRFEVSTSENPSEFLANFASIAKRAFKGRATNYAGQAAAPAPKLMNELTWRSKLVHAALAVGSLPFHLLARITGRAGALRILIVKPA
jgi:SAM-dependent methyltransferase